MGALLRGGKKYRSFKINLTNTFQVFSGAHCASREALPPTSASTTSKLLTPERQYERASETLSQPVTATNNKSLARWVWHGERPSLECAELQQTCVIKIRLHQLRFNMTPTWLLIDQENPQTLETAQKLVGNTPTQRYCPTVGKCYVNTNLWKIGRDRYWGGSHFQRDRCKATQVPNLSSREGYCLGSIHREWRYNNRLTQRLKKQ